MIGIARIDVDGMQLETIGCTILISFRPCPAELNEHPAMPDMTEEQGRGQFPASARSVTGPVERAFSCADQQNHGTSVGWICNASYNFGIWGPSHKWAMCPTEVNPRALQALESSRNERSVPPTVRSG